MQGTSLTQTRIPASMAADSNAGIDRKKYLTSLHCLEVFRNQYSTPAETAKVVA